MPAVPAEKLDDVLVMAENFEVIGVDEGQFVSIVTVKSLNLNSLPAEVAITFISFAIER